MTGFEKLVARTFPADLHPVGELNRFGRAEIRSGKHGEISSVVKRLTVGVLTSLTLVATASASEPITDRLVIVAEGGKGLSIADQKGEILWNRPNKAVHDLHLLENGNLLVNSGWPNIIEVNPAKEVVWSYDSATSNGNAGKKVEVHAFQPLEDGHLMIAESGPARIIEINRDGELVHEMPLKVQKGNPHTDTRLVRKLENGDYLVCHEGDGVVKRYTPDGTVNWEFEIPLFGREPARGHGPEAWGGKAFSAIVLQNGNYLISTGNGHSVLEVTPEKEIVWHLRQNDIPGVTLAWVTTLQEMPNGNFIIGNCHAGPENPQIIEVNREKELIWSWKNFETHGNALSNSLVVEGAEAALVRSHFGL